MVVDDPRPAPTFPAIRRAPDPPAAADVAALVDRATKHPLGVDFLLRGAPDAVAVTFGVHAFVVDAARDALRGTPRA